MYHKFNKYKCTIDRQLYRIQRANDVAHALSVLAGSWRMLLQQRAAGDVMTESMASLSKI